MDGILREFVKQRANHQCEYCRIPQEYDVLPFQIDHIISLKHHGSSEAANLALSCYNCNAYEGPNIAGIELDIAVAILIRTFWWRGSAAPPKCPCPNLADYSHTKEVTRLFHPRCDQWNEHFLWDSSYLTGLTAIGRTTIDVLSVNLPERVELRRTLIALGVSF
jgi:hypothetical protein